MTHAACSLSLSLSQSLHDRRAWGWRAHGSPCQAECHGCGQAARVMEQQKWKKVVARDSEQDPIPS
eukprot:855505-Amphidinium_carterae.1